MPAIRLNNMRKVGILTQLQRYNAKIQRTLFGRLHNTYKIITINFVSLLVSVLGTEGRLPP